MKSLKEQLKDGKKDISIHFNIETLQAFEKRKPIADNMSAFDYFVSLLSDEMRQLVVGKKSNGASKLKDATNEATKLGLSKLELAEAIKAYAEAKAKKAE